MRWIIWKLGKRFKFIRSLYYKKTKGNWLWGIIGYIKDYGDDHNFVTGTPNSMIEFLKELNYKDLTK